MVTIRSPFCGYHTIGRVELNDEDSSCYSDKSKSVSLRKCPHNHLLNNKAYLSAHSDKHLSDFLPTRWRQKSTGIDMEQNYVTVTVCIHGSWAHSSPQPKRQLGRFSRFCGAHSGVQPTDTRTDHATFVATGGVFALRCDRKRKHLKCKKQRC